MPAEETLLTVTGAARRVHRDRRTIERWCDAGMPNIEIRNDHGDIIARYIREADLLAMFREKLHANPSRRTSAPD